MILAPIPEGYPDRYLKCSQVCGAPAGERCVSRSGKVTDGRPSGGGITLDRPHNARKRSTRAPRDP